MSHFPSTGLSFGSTSSQFGSSTSSPLFGSFGSTASGFCSSPFGIITASGFGSTATGPFGHAPTSSPSLFASASTACIFSTTCAFQKPASSFSLGPPASSAAAGSVFSGSAPASSAAAGGGFAPASSAAAGGGFAPASSAAAGGGFAPASSAAAGGGFAPASSAAAGGGFAPASSAAAGSVFTGSAPAASLFSTTPAFGVSSCASTGSSCCSAGAFGATNSAFATTTFTGFSTPTSGSFWQAQSTIPAPVFGTPFRVSVDDDEKGFENGSTGCPITDNGNCKTNVEGESENVTDEASKLQAPGAMQREVEGIEQAQNYIKDEDLVSSTEVSSAADLTVASVAEAGLISKTSRNIQAESSDSSAISSAVEAMNIENQPCATSSAVEAAYCTLPPICADVDKFVNLPQTAIIIKQILAKHGDITMGSILKSINAKMTFLELVADVVSRLSSHTLETLSSEDLGFAKAVTADAVAVGFNVGWLQKRVKEISTASKLHAYYNKLNELEQQIEAAKKSLIEMDLHHAFLESAVANVSDGIELTGIRQCRLGQGLL